jgi:regulator of protease activity HflC (stomatin/prohibitin superfamily)
LIASKEAAMPSQEVLSHKENVVSLTRGFPILTLFLILIPADVAGLIASAVIMQNSGFAIIGFITAILVLIILILCLTGFFTLQPNEARVLVLFGKYKGTVKTSGFYWGNPFYTNGRISSASTPGSPEPATQRPGARQAMAAPRSLGRNKISLRIRTLNTDTLKVNDKSGNPIDIAAVVVWRVEDTAQATFDVDDYELYVATQSEAALRHLANLYPYDGPAEETTLRGNVDSVSQDLRNELQPRLAKAGVIVDEARLTHLAYSAEIAQVMLRSQQAAAVIAARQKIVEGAVGMVDMALQELDQKVGLNLDDERRAAMVSNLMVVLCSESEVHPIINTGTLYN